MPRRGAIRKRQEDFDVDVPAPIPASTTSAEGPVETILELQQTAGNRAVSRLIDERADPRLIQRQPDLSDEPELPVEHDAEPKVAAPDTGPAAAGEQPTAYDYTKKRNKHYKGEDKSSKSQVQALVAAGAVHLLAAKKHLAKATTKAEYDDQIKALRAGKLQLTEAAQKRLPGASIDALLKTMGWKPEDVKSVLKPSVTYEDDATRESYLVDDKFQRQGKPLDTGGMYSKFSGNNVGIYVMGTDGKLYVGSHKVGLFHHSSFLSGADVAAAGEICVNQGRIRLITNKSGHYWPDDQNMEQVLSELKSRGVSINVPMKLLKSDGSMENIKDAGKWLEDRKKKGIEPEAGADLPEPPDAYPD